MDRKLVKKLAFLMFLQGALAEEQHEHVHIEQPEWETIEDSAVSISGDTSTRLSIYTEDGR